jgi:pimeloyl-ACP methyl ester carboxylesterase
MQEGSGFIRKTAKLSRGTMDYFVAGKGPDAVYLHGAAGPEIGAVPLRMKQKFRVWLPVIPGFDGTPVVAGVTAIPGVAGLLAEFIDQVIGKPCEVVGHSSGAQLAAWLAVLHPEKIEQLVLMAPEGFGYGTAQPRDADLIARIGEIQAYTLILGGSRDERVPAQAVQALKSRIRRSQLLYVYDAAHAMEVDQPERVASLVEDFFLRGDAFIVNAGGASQANLNGPAA